MKQMEQYLKTGVGVSSISYKNEEGQPRLGGELQGKSDVPALFAQQSLIILQAHQKITAGMNMNSCSGKRNIQPNTIFYSVDNDSHILAPHECKNHLE